MHLLSGSFLRLSPHLPWLITIISIIGLILIGLVAYYTARAITKAKENTDPEQKVKTHFFGLLNEDYRFGEKLPHRGGALVDALTLRGYFRAGDFSMAFLRALNFLKEHLGGRGAEYIFPWYLMIGATGAGKTSMLDRCGLNLPVGRPDFEGLGDNSHCNWWYFDRSVVLDISGQFVLHGTGLTSDEKRWQLLLILLERYRGRRPMDGIILVIPADELVGPTALEHAELLGRAKQLYQKLCQAQDTLGMSVPIYVIISKCDILAGFKPYVSLMPSELRQQMFGWSSPYGVHEPFAASWVDEAFQTIGERFEDVKAELFAADIKEASREGAFLFPREFATLQEGVATYVASIFKFSTYREPFLLRGIYFCGEGVDLPSVLQAREESRTNPYPQLSFTRQEPLFTPTGGEICFVRDLFTEKIFREYSLALPVPARQKADYRSTLLSRAAVIAVIAGCALGSTHDYGRLKILREELLPVLYQMQQILLEEEKLANQGGGKEGMIGVQTQVLLKLMSKMHTTSFFALFLPSSWFSNIHDRIGKTLAIGYDQIIAQSVYQQFGERFKLIAEGKIPRKEEEGSATAMIGHAVAVAKKEAPSSMGASKDGVMREAHAKGGAKAKSAAKDAAKSKRGSAIAAKISNTLLAGVKHTFDPVKVEEFLELEMYVDQLIEFEHYLQKYNTLLNSADQSNLSEVTQYLFGFALPKESLEYLRRFKSSPHFSGHHSIDVLAYQQEARRLFKRKYRSYFKAVLELGPNYEPLQRLVIDLKRFSGEAHEALNNTELANLYREVTSSISSTVDFINLSTLNWLDREGFNPGEPYPMLINKLGEKSLLLGGDAALEMLKDAEASFDLFKKQLVQIGTQISGPFFANNNGVLVSAPSEGLHTLHSILGEFFGEPFMAVAPEGTFETIVTHEKRLIWDTNALARAQNLAEGFDVFIKDKLQRYPKELRETLRIMGQEHLEKHINYQLQQAQTYINAPRTVGVEALEEELRTLVPSFVAASPYLIKLLSTLTKSTVADSFIRLRDLTVAQAFGILETVDELLELEKLYAFSGGSFSWWNGEEGAGFRAFSAKDEGDLKHYFDIQRKRITYLAKDFAEPVLTFLQQEELKSADQNLTLVARWSRILAQLASYAKKKPDNTIISLENYVATELNELTYVNCFDKIDDDDLAAQSGDYFAEKKIELKVAAHKQCQKNSLTSLIKHYRKMAAFFNTKLAGRFPFVAPTLSKNSSGPEEEADPDDIKQFLTMAKAINDNMTYVLDHDKTLALSKNTVKGFLKKVRALTEMFSGFLHDGNGDDVPSFTVTPEFRVNKEHEVAANQIMNFDIDVGEGQIITKFDKGKSATWKYGNPVTLTFEWAEHGNSLPNSDPQQPALSAHGYAATFTYQNQWSLLWLLAIQGAKRGDFASSTDSTPYVLKFEIPVTPAPEHSENFPTTTKALRARVFVRLTIAASTKDGDRVLRYISFPTFAPHLDIDTNEQADKDIAHILTKIGDEKPDDDEEHTEAHDKNDDDNNPDDDDEEDTSKKSGDSDDSDDEEDSEREEDEQDDADE